MVILKPWRPLPIQRAWMNKEVKAISKAQKATFWSGDKEPYHHQSKTESWYQGGKEETSATAAEIEEGQH